MAKVEQGNNPNDLKFLDIVLYFPAMVGTHPQAQVANRIVQTRLAATGLHFDLIKDEWPPLEDNKVLNSHHSLTYRFAPRALGEGCYAVGQGLLPYLPMGNVVLIPALTPLHLRGAGGTMIHGRLEFALGLFPELDALLSQSGPKTFERCLDVSCPEVTQILHKLIAEARNPDCVSQSVLANLGQLLSLYVRRFLSREEAISAPSADPLVAFRQTVEQHMQSLPILKTSVEGIAADLNLSPRQFSRKFRSYYDLSFSEYLQKRRISKAAALLANSSQSLKLIAHRCGYADHPAFSRHFHSVTGTSPAAYRKIRQGGR